jgi:hypothetical protein
LWVIFDPRGRSDTSLFVRFAPKAAFTNQDVIRRFAPLPDILMALAAVHQVTMRIITLQQSWLISRRQFHATS